MHSLRVRTLHAARRRLERQATVRRPGGPRRHVRGASHCRFARRGVLPRPASRRADRGGDRTRRGGCGHLADCVVRRGDRSRGIGGARRAAQLFAFLPYQLLLSITFILFPMVARAHAQHQKAAVEGYVNAGFRLAFLIGGLMVSCTCGLAPLLLRLAFVKQAADDGSTALRILALRQGAFAIFGIETTVLVSLSRERRSAQLTRAAA